MNHYFNIFYYWKSIRKNLYGIKPISPTSLRALMKLVLERNCFEFKWPIFPTKNSMRYGKPKQISPKSAILSCIKILKIIPTDPSILKWLRYRDKILLLYKETTFELSNLVAKMNEIHSSLKFTIEVSDNEVTYLDLKIFKGTKFQSSGILDTKVYTKAHTFQ